MGCAFSNKIVYSEFFSLNPDQQDPALNTPLGVYAEHTGLDNVHMSWGHDEYLYHVVKNYLPDEALYMIRYHRYIRPRRPPPPPRGAAGEPRAPADHAVDSVARASCVRRCSFYSQHRENAYNHLLNDKDQALFEWVRKFNPYDLYSKGDAPPDVAALKPFYEELIAEFFPPELDW